MVDTNRPKADLQTILGDNVAGDISAQDVRDFLESVFRESVKGDLAGIDALGLRDALTIGIDGDVLIADAASTLGFKWDTPGAAVHPNLAAHDALGLATDAELATHAALEHWPVMTAATELTLTANSNGAITVTQDHHIVRTLGAAASGELITINGSVDNKWLILRAEPGGTEEITITEDGNIRFTESDRFSLKFGSDFFVRLWFNPDFNYWLAEDPQLTVGLQAEDGSAFLTAQSRGFGMQGIWNWQSQVVDIDTDRVLDVSFNVIRVRPETGTADDIDGIEINATSGFALGQVLYVCLADTGDTITLRHNNAGGASGSKLFMQGDADIVLSADQDFAILLYNDELDSGNGGWMVLSNKTSPLLNYNVHDYGAIGDGSTDDTTAIAAAVTAANAAGGGNVYFRGLTYKITAALTLKNNVTLSGMGKATVIRQVTNAANGFVVTPNTTIQGSRIGIRDMTIQSGHATAGTAISLGSVRDVDIERIWIEGQTQNTHRWTNGISIYDASAANFFSGEVNVRDFRIMDIRSAAGSCGIYVNTGIPSILDDAYSRITFSDGRVESFTYYDDTSMTQTADIGVLLEGGRNVHLTNVVVREPKYGLVITPSTAGQHTKNASIDGYLVSTRINGCMFWNIATTQGALFKGSIAGLTVVSTGIYGPIKFDQTAAESQGFNSLYFTSINTTSLITFSNTQGLAEDLMGPIVFTSCNFHGTGSGVSVTEGPQKFRINGNEFWSNTQGYIDAGSVALNGQLMDNRFYGCTTNATFGNSGSRDEFRRMGNMPETVNKNTFDVIFMQSKNRTITAYEEVIGFGTTLTMNFVNTVVGGFVFGGTILYQQAGFSLTMATAFVHATTYRNAANVNPGPIRGYWDVPTINAVTNTITAASAYSFESLPTVGAPVSGSMVVTALTGFRTSATVNSGGTVTTRRGIHILDVSGAGTVTTQIGLDIDNITGAGTDVGIRNQSNMRQTGYMSLTGGAPTNVAAGELTAIRLKVVDGAFGTGVDFSVTGDGALSGFLRVGSETAPSNTAALTANRALVGTDAAFPNADVQMWVNQGTIDKEIMRWTTTATNDDPTEYWIHSRDTTTNNSGKTVQSITIPASTTTYVETRVIARRTGGASGAAEDGAVYHFSTGFKNTAGTVAIIGVTTADHTGESQAGWNATHSIGTNVAKVDVLGATGNDITWHIHSRVWSVAS